MDLTVLCKNIERRLSVLNLSADAASKLAGRPDSIRNIQRKARGDLKGTVKIDTLLDLADALQTTLTDLLRVETGASVQPIPGLRAYLLAQRTLIDEQIAALDEAETPAKPTRKIKNR